MRAVGMEESGGVEVLKLVQKPPRSLREGEALVRVAAAVNPADLLTRESYLAGAFRKATLTLLAPQAEVRWVKRLVASMGIKRFAVRAFVLVSLSTPLHAQPYAVERFEIVEDRIAYGGHSFGEVGPYHLILAKAHLSIAPDARANRAIIDLGKAPPDFQGIVHYTSDIAILRPVSAAHARKVIIAEVPNRGIRLIDGMINNAPLWGPMPGVATAGTAPAKPALTPEDAGSGFAFRRGYTFVAVGWQGDLPAAGHLLRAKLPVANNGGASITGRVHAAAVFDTNDAIYHLNLAYPVATGMDRGATLTVRPRAGAPSRTLPASSWRFEGPKQVSIYRPPGMDAGAIYEFSYTAKDPIVAGLGFAATRDMLSFLKHAKTRANPLADLNNSKLLGFGVSQSGRFLRDMLWQGFNADTAGRPVFDGELVVIAGARTTFTNRRWAEPGRFSRQHEDPLVYGNQFPFTYGVATDPLTGRTDGLLSACLKSGTCPKIIHLDGSSEFWSAGAALVGSDGAGHDITFPANVRAYMVAGAPHAPALVAPSSALPANPLNDAPVVRALLVALDKWVADEAEAAFEPLAIDREERACVAGDPHGGRLSRVEESALLWTR